MSRAPRPSSVPLLIAIIAAVAAVGVCVICGGLGVAGFVLWRNVTPDAPIGPGAKAEAGAREKLAVDKDARPKPDKDAPPKEGGAAPEEVMAALRDGKFVVPGAAAQATTYLRFVSTKGDYIGGGKDYSSQADEVTVRRFDKGVEVGAGGWGIHFEPPRGGEFQSGEYLGAKRWPFQGDAPGISVSGHGRGCNQVAGLFRVWEFQTEDAEVTRLAVDFIHRCEITGPPLYGMVRYKSRYQ